MQQSKTDNSVLSNVDLLYRLAPMGVGLSFLFAIIFFIIIWPVAQEKQLVAWGVVCTLVASVRAYSVWRYFVIAPPPSQQEGWELSFIVLAAISALLWGMIAIFFFPEDQPLYQLFSFVMLAGLAAGAISTTASSPRCYRVYVTFLLLPLIVRLFLLGGEIYLTLAFLTLVFMSVLSILSQRIYSKIHETQQVRQEDIYRSAVMEMLAKGAPLPQILKAIVVGVEAQDAAIICSIQLLDDTGQHIAGNIAPNLPESYNARLIGMPLEPAAGSCITAMFTGKRFVAEDIRTHPYWARYRDIALDAGLQSCWSEPIKLASGRVVGSFAIYHRTPSEPNAMDIRRIEIAGSIAGLALERRQSEKEHELAAMVYRNSSEAMVVTDAEEHVIAVNKAFTLITGYTLDDMIGRGMDFSARNNMDIDDYRQMMNSVLAIGKWQGELWNYRKNGERFACRVTINSIYDSLGMLSRRVLLLSDITEQKRSDEMIWQQANYDPLTALPNRRLFRDRLEQEIKKAHRAGLYMGLMFLDLDRFKEINDSLGHDVGDRLLIEAAKRISACVRESDTVARLGGDEFTIILSEIEDTRIIDRVAGCIIEKIAEAFHLDNDVIHISVSIGITVCPDDSTETEALLRNADLAMYAAKNAGRNRFSYFTSATQREAQNRVQITNDLHDALEAGEFELHYQPIVELAANTVSKAEALLRWRHPTRGLVSPAQFIPRAEETGLIIDIGDWVFREAAKTAKKFSEQTGNDFQISVNVSPVQCHAMADCNHWLACLRELGLQGQNVTIEITEGLLLGAAPHIANLLLQFRNAGINVAIDDFGTGYSSLSYLKKFDIDFLKIDQSFVRDLASDPNDRALAETIIVMGHNLGLKVIAEGVETMEQCSILKQAGCDYAQGYLFSRPLPAGELSTRLLAASSKSHEGFFLEPT